MRMLPSEYFYSNVALYGTTGHILFPYFRSKIQRTASSIYNRPDITLAVYRGRKAPNQTNINICFEQNKKKKNISSFFIYGSATITVIIFVFSRYNTLMNRYLLVWLLPKQGYQKFHLFLKRTSI